MPARERPISWQQWFTFISFLGALAVAISAGCQVSDRVDGWFSTYTRLRATEVVRDSMAAHVQRYHTHRSRRR